jgi:LPXTG-motif cell wall-anchored protein
MSESNTPPQLPEIVDEAGDSSIWLPVVGLALLAFIALLFVVMQAQGPDDHQEPQAVEVVEGE